ncbi:hypothetical protein PSHT_00936 [Puccinia striiformis]|uniref:40S ribosomal protein S27 n=1 Tax=Puccinia striiformis TaxID=27350 RepID=A0A2S4WLW2_9BASI|nr:hypothetical protein PSHT_00936 [Puccinia striiformis]
MVSTPTPSSPRPHSLAHPALNVVLMTQLIFSIDARGRSPQPFGRTRTTKAQVEKTGASPNSYFMDVKCPGCFNITTVFSHAQTVVLCGSCATVLCQPTGGKARLTEGCSFRRKN